MDIYEKTLDLTFELTRILSVVGSKGEIDAAIKIYELLAELDYFKANPGNLKIKDLKGDALGRKYVLAIVEGRPEAKDAVLTLGHIDTVGIEDYADLKPYATDPVALKEKLAEKVFTQEVTEDLKSDNWLFGRGIFDMKTGVATLITMVEIFSKRARELSGHLIFIAVPDEEGNSAGMLSAVEDLSELANEKGWDFIAAIDTDYMTGHYPSDENKYVYIGSVGKLLPCFYVFGKETHVGEVFSGFDANLLASEVMCQIDMNSNMCDIADGEVTLPPISLFQRDLKTDYSVQTVNAVNIYFNYAINISTPEEVINKIKERAMAAFEKTISKLNVEYGKFCKLSGIPYSDLPWKAQVLTFDELYKRVKMDIGDQIDEKISSLAEKLIDNDIDEREFSLRIVQEVHRHCADKNPMIVVYFAPPYYPHMYLQGEDAREKRLLSAVKEVVDEACKYFDYNVVIKKFYPYISDLSYCSISSDTKAIEDLVNNMPAWPAKYSLPVEAIQRISMPVVNIGPYGKDAHKLTERVSLAYSFDAMPFILEKTIEKLLRL